ncbi:hypothetical protein [Parvibaculum sp.]|uniref:hypothetical protein n=1 Tax=Parvibaculum sp. TaxID=2024848 RepID=UPI00261780DF|nr:hypothetical protein [Parvibaculum sp.]MCW5728157.1 hypothetical protein [Parvibaculum sp.]
MDDLLQGLLLLQLGALIGIGGIFWRVGGIAADMRGIDARVEKLERKVDGLA